MNMLVQQIKKTQEVIKEFMQKTWTKLEELENAYKTLRAAKIPLISYGAKESNGSALIFSTQDTCRSKNQDLPSATVLLYLMGHNKET